MNAQRATPVRPLLALLFTPLFTLATLPAQAAVITFDFEALAEGLFNPITGQLADGTPFSGTAQAGAYRYFSWEQGGLTVTVSANYWTSDEWGEAEELQPSYTYLQPSYAGLGACPSVSCSSAQIGYLDQLTLSFDQQVELTGIRFTTGEDPWNNEPEDDSSGDDGEPDPGVDEEEEDYRAYNMRINMSGGPDGPEGTEMNSRETWSGSLSGNQLQLGRSEGTGAYVGSITVRTADAVDVPEPASLSLLGLAAAAGWWGRRRTNRRGVS